MFFNLEASPFCNIDTIFTLNSYFGVIPISFTNILSTYAVMKGCDESHILIEFECGFDRTYHK